MSENNSLVARMNLGRKPSQSGGDLCASESWAELSREQIPPGAVLEETVDGSAVSCVSGMNVAGTFGNFVRRIFMTCSNYRAFRN